MWIVNFSAFAWLGPKMFLKLITIIHEPKIKEIKITIWRSTILLINLKIL